MVERIRYSVYGEPTVFPYSFADCADTSSGDGPDGYITTHDQTQFNAWYGATPKDIRADVADDLSVVPMDLGSNTGVFDSGGLGDQDAFNGGYGANGGLYPVAGAASLVPGFWSNGGATGATGPTDSPVSDIGYCGYAWNPGSGQYAVRFRNYDPALGRWLQRDPLGYVGGMSLSNYCDSRPSRFTDSTGLIPDTNLPGYYDDVMEECEAWAAAHCMQRLARLAKDGISSTDDFLFWYKHGAGDHVDVSPLLLDLFQKNDRIAEVLDKIRKDIVESAVASMPAGMTCRPGASWRVSASKQYERSTTMVILGSTTCGDPRDPTFSYGQGFIWADSDCIVTVRSCSNVGTSCQPAKVSVRCNINLRADDKFTDPLSIHQAARKLLGIKFVRFEWGDPYWFYTRWREQLRDDDVDCGNPSSCKPKCQQRKEPW